MSKKTSYWKQKLRADAAERELRALRLRCGMLVSNWGLTAKKAAAGSPLQTHFEQCSRELTNAMDRARADAVEATKEAEPTEERGEGDRASR